MSVKQIVVDASVALKWRLKDEEATSQADALLEDFLAGRLELISPTLLLVPKLCFLLVPKLCLGTQLH